MTAFPNSFDKLIKTADLPVLVDFWAAWCGPCSIVSPAIKQIAHEYAGKLVTVKVNTQEKFAIAAEYKIASLPTIMMFWKGQAVMRLAGAYPYEELKRQIEEHLPRP